MILRQPTRRSPEVNTPGRSCNRDLYLLGLTQRGLRVTSLQRHSRFGLVCFDIWDLVVCWIACWSNFLIHIIIWRISSNNFFRKNSRWASPTIPPAHGGSRSRWRRVRGFSSNSPRWKQIARAFLEQGQKRIVSLRRSNVPIGQSIDRSTEMKIVVKTGTRQE